MGLCSRATGLTNGQLPSGFSHDQAGAAQFGQLRLQQHRETLNQAFFGINLFSAG